MDQQFRTIKRIEKILLLLVIGIALISSLSKTFLFLLIPWIFGNYFIVFTNLLFHKNCDPHDKMNLSKNYTNPIENFLFLNGGYHTIHHLYPRVHWSQLPRMHQKYVGPFISPKLTLNSMLLDTYHSYVKNGFVKVNHE